MSKIKTTLQIFLDLLKGADKFTTGVLADGTDGADGTEIKYEGELIVGVKVEVEVDGVDVPLSEGEHVLGGELKGKSIVVDAAGIVLEIKETEEAATEAPEEQAAREAEEAQNTELAKIAFAKFTELLSKISALELRAKTAEDKFTALVKDIVADSVDKKKFNHIKTNLNDKLKRLIP